MPTPINSAAAIASARAVSVGAGAVTGVLVGVAVGVKTCFPGVIVGVTVGVLVGVLVGVNVGVLVGGQLEPGTLGSQQNPAVLPHTRPVPAPHWVPVILQPNSDRIQPPLVLHLFAQNVSQATESATMLHVDTHAGILQAAPTFVQMQQ